jgi:hypothetical protein
MQLKNIAAAVAAGSLGFCGPSWALEPGSPIGIEIFMAGATAQDINLRQLFIGLCVDGTLDVYLDNERPPSPGRAHSAFFCNLDSNKVTGLTAPNPPVLFHKRSAGGSAQGVGPVLEGMAITSMAVTAGNCVRDTALDAEIGARAWRCRLGQPGDTLTRVPDAGVSDVNPELFRGINTPTGIAPVDPARAAERLDVVSGGTLVFGLPVTTALRDALQRAQIDMGTLAPECEGRDTEACMPSLSKHQLASLLTGQIGDWRQVQVVGRDGAARGDLTQYARGAITSNLVHICRRVDGSGTQATFNAKIQHAPCTDGALAPASTSNPAIGPIVVLGPGAGDVDLCLDDFNQGTNNSRQNPGNARAWAIGLQTTERNTDLRLNYRYIALDGVAPTLENTASGHYMNWVELTYQWRKAAFEGPTGDKLTILRRIAADAGSPSIMARNNARFVHPWGRGGYLASTTAGHAAPADGRFDPANPINPYTHAPGLPLDNCRVPLVDANQPSRL